jgi:hypothetical protein
VNPLLGIYLNDEKEEEILELARKNHMRLEIIEDPRMHREEFGIFSLDGKRDLKSEFV